MIRRRPLGMMRLPALLLGAALMLPNAAVLAWTATTATDGTRWPEVAYKPLGGVRQARRKARVRHRSWHGPPASQLHQRPPSLRAAEDAAGDERSPEEDPQTRPPEAKAKRPVYDLGIGKNRPVGDDADSSSSPNELDALYANWNVPEPVRKPPTSSDNLLANGSRTTLKTSSSSLPSRLLSRNLHNTKPFTRTRRMVARDEESRRLRAALWDELHYSGSGGATGDGPSPRPGTPPPSRTATANGAAMVGFPEEDYPGGGGAASAAASYGFAAPPRPKAFHPNIDLSIPESVYSEDGSVDLVWDLLRWEAFQQAQREPLLVSFLHSTILNHDSLESSLAFLLANRLQSAGMISTQLQSIIMDALHHSPTFRRNLRADIMAVRDRDPACNYLPDVFLYFKGFHALQTHRVAHYLWNCDSAEAEEGSSSQLTNSPELSPTSTTRDRRRRPKAIMAKFLQSQVSQMFQIDIHPNATLGSGIMLDHGTGIVIGETATVGHNCSVLHHVTLGGSGKKGVKRHPSVGDGVLLGAGATVLGPVTIGEGSQIGAGTLVISDLPPHSVAVGVPARIIGSFVDVTQQPSIGMDQMISPHSIITFESEGI